MDVSGQLHTPAALHQAESPWYPFDRRLNGSRTSLDTAVENKKSPVPPVIEPQSWNP